LKEVTLSKVHRTRLLASSDSVGINFGTNPFSQIEGPEVQSAPPYLNLEEQESASEKNASKVK